jgi:hypothetical protein
MKTHGDARQKEFELFALVMATGKALFVTAVCWFTDLTQSVQALIALSSSS